MLESVEFAEIGGNGAEIGDGEGIALGDPIVEDGGGTPLGEPQPEDPAFQVVRSARLVFHSGRGGGGGGAARPQEEGIPRIDSADSKA